MTADRLYERRWALALLDRVLARLKPEFASVGKQILFEELKPSLSGGKCYTPK